MAYREKKGVGGLRKSEVAVYTHFEQVLARVRPFGPYQIFCSIVILYATIEWAGNVSFMDSLGSVEPDWNCTLQNGSFITIGADTDKDAKCDALKQCKAFTAKRDSVEFYSVRAAFKLICDENDKVMWIEVFMSGGSLLGSLIGGHIGDFFGRQMFFLTGQLLFLLTSVMVTASQNWLSFAVIMAVNSILYGLLETTTLTMMMEYTSNKYRLILAACFQWPLAYMVMALIAYLVRDWQTYFVFLNLVGCPLAIAFMLFHESPRWLIARNELDRACDVLNDMAHERWNNTKARFTTRDLSSIHKESNTLRFYNIFHLFANRRLAKQTLIQILSVFTYALVSNTYLYTASSVHNNAIMFTLLDGIFRIFTPFIIIALDIRFKLFGRKLQFIGALIIEAILLGVVILLLAFSVSPNSSAVTILSIVSTMINDCVFWLNIIQITTQRYPTVIRCVAFGVFQAVKHAGAIVGIVLLQPLSTTSPIISYIIPEAFILITLVAGIVLQPETKGKALMDQMVEGHYGRVENEIPKALIKLAAGHKLRQIEVREQLRRELDCHEDAAKKGNHIESPWIYKGDSRSATPVQSHAMAAGKRAITSSDDSTTSTDRLQEREESRARHAARVNAGFSADSDVDDSFDDVADDDDYVNKATASHAGFDASENESTPHLRL